MEQQRFDGLTRGMAARGTRRGVLRGLTGLLTGGVAAVWLGHSGRFARSLQSATDSDEQSVVLYAEMARIAHDHVGNCDDLSIKLKQFGRDHAVLLAKIKSEQDGWSYARRVEHTDTYGDRREEASIRLQAALSRCQFSVSPSSPTLRSRRRLPWPLSSIVLPHRNSVPRRVPAPFQSPVRIRRRATLRHSS